MAANLYRSTVQRNVIVLEGERSAQSRNAHGRLVLLSVFFVLSYLVLMVRAFDLTVIQAVDFRGLDVAEVSQKPVENKVIPVSVRGDIYDRNGEILATTLKTASLYADTRSVADKVGTAQALVSIFPDLMYSRVLQDLQSGKRFVWLKRSITPAQQKDVLSIGEPGLGFEYEYKRVYPQGALVSHVLGYTNVDGDGLAALERSFDNLLRSGAPLSLSLDVRVQHAVRRAVQKSMDEFGAIGGTGLVMDVKTGELVAAVSLPDFDLHAPGKADKNTMFNRMVLGVYELGSVFKIFSTAALLDQKHVPLSATFDAREPIRRGRFTINDYHGEDRVLTIPEVFMYSSNIGSAMMGEAVGTEGLQNFYRDLGLLDRLDFEIKEVGRPLVPNPWRDIHTLTASYGHGVAVTPMQLVAAVSSIVNDGYLVRPTLVKTPDDVFAERIEVVSQGTSDNIKKLLRLTVTDGTGKNADVPGYFVGGKTGTAEKPGVRGYSRDKLISSFVGIFPAHAPRYTIFVAIDEPKGHPGSYGYATGGWVAAPAVKNIVQSMVSILGIKPFESQGIRDPADELRHYVSSIQKKGH